MPSAACTSSTLMYLPAEERYSSAPPRPMRAPEMSIAVMIIRLASTPKPMLASRFLPQAFSSKPKFVFSSRMYTMMATTITMKMPIFAELSGKIFSRPAVGRR